MNKLFLALVFSLITAHAMEMKPTKKVKSVEIPVVGSIMLPNGDRIGFDYEPIHKVAYFSTFEKGDPYFVRRAVGQDLKHIPGLMKLVNVHTKGMIQFDGRIFGLLFGHFNSEDDSYAIIELPSKEARLRVAYGLKNKQDEPIKLLSIKLKAATNGNLIVKLFGERKKDYFEKYRIVVNKKFEEVEPVNLIKKGLLHKNTESL